MAGHWQLTRLHLKAWGGPRHSGEAPRHLKSHRETAALQPHAAQDATFAAFDHPGVTHDPPSESAARTLTLLGKAAWSEWPPWWRHGWPPEAHETALEGLRLLYALGRRGQTMVKRRLICASAGHHKLL